MTSPRRDGKGKPLIWWLWVGYWAALFVATHVSLRRHVSLPIPDADKVIHCGVYFLLTMLGGRYRLVTGRSTSLAVLLGWAILYAAYGGLDEWLQQFTGRSMCLNDWIADVIGIAAATTILAFGRRSSKPPSPASQVR